MAIVKQNWSGGKDSTAALKLHLLQGDKVKACCYIPMFNEKIPLIGKEHYNFLINTAEYFQNEGAEIYFLKGLTYLDFCLTMTKRGVNRGKIYGFPLPVTGLCGFKRDSKLKALSFNCGFFDYEDIGIAFDEPKRFHNLSDFKRSILYERKLTEKDAFNICNNYGILSPHYKFVKRDGCSVCPNAKRSELERWFQDWEGAEEGLRALENICKEFRPDRPPLRGGKWFFD